ncbi:hypothetical protein B9479_003643 [Cryptococcus floricola]|uniref:Uncharacterized protein n=1 Tax=Cryptococcus floricola TaxID=2591691 RepID=A0A5D3AZB1_9TREE|nr:hypothetical protein B9479_003643 [Cryptococcus floricola]
MSTELQAEPTPSQGDELQDEFSRIPEENFTIMEDFKIYFEINTSNGFERYESDIKDAKDSIYYDVEEEVRSALEAEVALRKREGRTEGLMGSVRVFPEEIF